MKVNSSHQIRIQQEGWNSLRTISKHFGGATLGSTLFLVLSALKWVRKHCETVEVPVNISNIPRTTRPGRVVYDRQTAQLLDEFQTLYHIDKRATAIVLALRQFRALDQDRLSSALAAFMVR
jgi:hypothetical protein